MEGERQTSVNLPEEIEERILALVPFPYVFKARALSKSWQAKFWPISPEDDEDEKCPAASFQELVGKSSSVWKTFCPIFFGQKDFLAYDREVDRWQRLPWLSFLPKNLFSRAYCWRLEGALLLICEREKWDGIRRFPKVNMNNLYVANMLTRSWKQLPPQLLWDKFGYRREDMSIHISSPQAYKVVIFHDGTAAGNLLAEVYDSKSGAWRVEAFGMSKGLLSWRTSNWANLNGVLYNAVGLHHNKVSRHLLAFNVQDENFQVLDMPSVDKSLKLDEISLTVCNGSLLMLVYDDRSPHAATSVIVQKIDLGSRRWSEVTRGPPVALKFGTFAKKPSSDGDCIFFVGARADRAPVLDSAERRVLVYNMLEDHWSAFPMPVGVRDSYNPLGRSIRNPHVKMKTKYEWAPSSFQPGLNPFLAV